LAWLCEIINQHERKSDYSFGGKKLIQYFLKVSNFSISTILLIAIDKNSELSTKVNLSCEGLIGVNYNEEIRSKISHILNENGRKIHIVKWKLEKRTLSEKQKSQIGLQIEYLGQHS
jgi:hypothetical protein